jgi:thiamine-phosphate pyrophosphorylase
MDSGRAGSGGDPIRGVSSVSKSDAPHPGVRARIPRLHLITDDAILAHPDFLDRVSRLVASLPAGGGDLAFHLRGPGTSTRTLWTIGKALLKPLRPAGVSLLVNDRADLAQALEADGVHLPARGLPTAWVRGWMGEGRWLGRSLHAPGAGLPDGVEALDYGIVGTLWSSLSHPGRAGSGAGRISDFRRLLADRGAEVALIGIGGVTLERLAEVRAAGGDGVAVRGAVWNSDDPGRVVRDLLTELSRWGPRHWNGGGGHAED